LELSTFYYIGITSKNVSKKKEPTFYQKVLWMVYYITSFITNKEEHNFDLNEDLDILGYNEECVEEFQGEEPSTQKKRKLKVK
jgi:hypothetical protein